MVDRRLAVETSFQARLRASYCQESGFLHFLEESQESGFLHFLEESRVYPGPISTLVYTSSLYHPVLPCPVYTMVLPAVYVGVTVLGAVLALCPLQGLVLPSVPEESQE